MSTHGLLGFRFDGVLKGCYNRYDSYPKGLGADVVDFIQTLSPNELKLFNENIRKVEWVNINDMPTDEQLEKFIGYDISKFKGKPWYKIV